MHNPQARNLFRRLGLLWSFCLSLYTKTLLARSTQALYSIWSILGDQLTLTATMAQHLGLSKNNHKFGMFIFILYFTLFFVLSLQTRAHPHSPLTSPRRTKRRVRGYLFYTHESSSLSFFYLILHASNKVSLYFFIFLLRTISWQF